MLCLVFLIVGCSYLNKTASKETPTKVDYFSEITLYEKKSNEFCAFDYTEFLREKREAEGFKLYVAGDIMFHSPQLSAALKSGEYDFFESFRYVKDVIKDGLAIANFETTIAEDNFMGYPMFRTPAAAVKNLKFAGFDILGLANNHALDGKLEGVIRTKQTVLDNDIVPLGTYFEGEETFPQIVEVNGRKIAFLNYTYGLNGLDGFLGGKDYMINILNEEKVKNDINYAKKNADGIIVMVHWGNEYVINNHVESQERWLNFFNQNGVDAVLGSHPHVIEPDGFLENNGHKMYYIYSLGNFLSNQRREYMNQPYGEDGVILELTIKPFDKKRIEVKDVVYHPTWVKRTKDPLTYEILPVYDGLMGFIPELTAGDIEKLKESKDRTLSILKTGKYIGDIDNGTKLQSKN